MTGSPNSHLESKLSFETALWMQERAVRMSTQAGAMYLSAYEAVAEAIEMRTRPRALSSTLAGCYHISQTDYRAMLTRMLSSAIALTSADMGNIQLFDPRSQMLKIEVQSGFDSAFLDFFAHVHTGQFACGAAMKQMSTVVIKDVTRSPIFRDAHSLEVMLDARARAVQSTPLIGRSGAFLGVLSTHWRKPCSLDRATLSRIDFLKQVIADFVQICVPLGTDTGKSTAQTPE